MNCKLQRLVRQVVCLVVGHHPAFSGQAYEQVTAVRQGVMNGLKAMQENDPYRAEYVVLRFIAGPNVNKAVNL